MRATDRRLDRRSSTRRKPRLLVCEPLEARRLLANVNGIATTGVYDENVVDPNTVDFVATGSSLTNTQFASQVASAFGQDMGGVIAGGLGVLYNYGSTQAKTMILEPTDGTNWGIGTGYHISGTSGFATSAPYNLLSMNFLQIENASPDEHVVTFGLTALSITGRDYGTVTLTGRLAGGGTASASRPINNATGAGDTFFALSAPAGDYFTGFALSYSGAVFGTPDTRLWFDDLGFITAPVNRANNLAPVANDDSYNTPQNQTLAIGGAGVLANDFDPDGNPLSTILVSGPAHGSLLLNPEGAFWYTPTTGYTGPDSFTYKAFDTQDASNVATVNLNVTPPNRPPVALNDSYAVIKNQPLTVAAPGVLGNDSDPDGNPISTVLVSSPAHGTLALAANGSFTYTPAGNYVGADSFTYRASDGSLSSNLATVSLKVSDPNAPPVANNDSFTMRWNTSLNIQAAGVLANDTDPNGLPLTAVNPTQPAHGTLTLNANGSFTYMPNAGYFGIDSFTYQASDGTLASNVATVNITIQQVFARPTAVADRYTTQENTPLTVAAPGVLANDSDPNGLPLTPIVTSSTTHGTLTVNGDGSLTYVPAKNFYGTDSFNYYVTDGKATSLYVTDTITVAHVNQPPVANSDGYSVDENSSLTTAAAQTDVTMVSQPGDFVGAGQTYNFGTSNSTIGATVMSGGVYTNTVAISVSTPGGEYWTLHFAAPNQARLLPGVYNGATRWPFQSTNTPGLDVSGDGRGSNNLFGSFTVTQALYDASGNIVAFAASFEQHSESPTAPALTGQVAYRASFDKPEGVLFNDTDPDGDPLRASVVAGPSHGSLAFHADGSFTYTPNANYYGADQFSYQANDGALNSNVATVSLTVNKVDQAPVSVPDSYTALENTLLNVAAAAGVLVNDSDPEADPLTVALVSGPVHGTLTLNPDGSFSYMPGTNFFGPDQFSYKANDGTLDGNVATVSITVNHVNQPPVASDDSYTLNENEVIATNAPGILANDTDPDGDPLMALLLSAPSHGTLSLSPSGSFSYRADANYVGADSFTYQAFDGSLKSTPATVRLLINRINQPPLAQDDQFTIAENNNIGVGIPGVLLNDVSPNHEPLTATLVAGPSHGTLTFSSDGGFSYAPATDFFGVDTFTYSASDLQSTSSPATVTINVVRRNQPPVANDDRYTINENQQIGVGAPGVLGNDTSPNLEPLTATLVAQPAHGTVSFSSSGAFTYAAAPNFYGTDTFTYTASDRVLTSGPATVTITVNHVNQPPVALDDSYSTNENTPLDIGAPGVLANDYDPDNDPISPLIVAGPLHGSLTLNSDGSFRYLPAANYFGPDDFTYQVSDGALTSAAATVHLTVNHVNQPPVALADSFSVRKNGSLTIIAPGVLANDLDPNGTPLVATLVTGPSHGALTLKADGSFTYRPKKNYTGTDSFTYTARDATLASNPAVVMINVLNLKSNANLQAQASAPDSRASSLALGQNSLAPDSIELVPVVAPQIALDDSMLWDVAATNLLDAKSKSRSKPV
ncbi:hypothetical protein SAMN05444166_2918 [Singulisphaera sp. GP187]|uniref:Ig-like domain-containing protein n=1 Tax=Singulisphaera sp. GP187 TaxID=1882752 RepID=UPI000927AB11|nr:Ig-like domain-containing protein [Singulisphaera sp. GP187]SIO19312.1 hypothetical protein SAMN05444166_2918 [Singulisphaera sp. GP187]